MTVLAQQSLTSLTDQCLQSQRPHTRLNAKFCSSTSYSLVPRACTGDDPYSDPVNRPFAMCSATQLMANFTAEQTALLQAYLSAQPARLNQSDDGLDNSYEKQHDAVHAVDDAPLLALLATQRSAPPAPQELQKEEDEQLMQQAIAEEDAEIHAEKQEPQPLYQGYAEDVQRALRRALPAARTPTASSSSEGGILTRAFSPPFSPPPLAPHLAPFLPHFSPRTAPKSATFASGTAIPWTTRHLPCFHGSASCGSIRALFSRFACGEGRKHLIPVIFSWAGVGLLLFANQPNFDLYRNQGYLPYQIFGAGTTKNVPYCQ
ncbi:hypothetical protein BDR22DRAFT_889339 [Usnea florida]